MLQRLGENSFWKLQPQSRNFIIDLGIYLRMEPKILG